MSFPFYKQLDAMDCGPASLRIVASFYGIKHTLQSLRDLCHTTHEGVSMLGISDAAEAIGFRTTGVKITFSQLCENVNLPCIVHWNKHHFVVVYKIKKTRSGYDIYVSDPACGLLKYDVKSFLKAWETTDKEGNSYGAALLLEPTPEFFRDKDFDTDHKLSFGFLMKYIKPYRKYIVQVLLAMITGSIISLIAPFLTQAVVDHGIGNNDIDFVVVILIAQVALVIGQMANNLIRSWLMLHVMSRMSIALISDFLSKLMRLPISYFDTKMVGDIMQRIGDHSRIQSFLTGSLISIFMAVITFIVYGAIMAGYNLSILAVFLMGSILYVVWILLFLKRRRKLDYMRFQSSSDNQSNLVQLINGMQDIKLNGCEKQKRWEWEHIQIKLFNVSIKGLTLSQTQQIGATFIDQAKNVIISFLAASMVINGEISLGMMMAMQYIIGQLNAPVSQFISFIQASQDAKISLERLNEIHEREDEDPADKPKIYDIPENSDIIFENVMFQYEGPRSEKVLDNINITIPAKRVTAIVGMSGSGKSTLLKLLLGFYEPVEGCIKLGDRPLSKYNSRRWRKHCGVVMQDGYVFSDTILGNISVSDETPSMDKVGEAMKIANIGDYIESLPLGYNTKIGIDGHGLSSGQKQRILIARAAYKNAPYLFFDEATNALDANNEKIIMENLDLLFKNKTVIIIAHRLSSVKKADNIIVLENGKVAEQGTHKSLVRLKGAYYELVHNQLELED